MSNEHDDNNGEGGFLDHFFNALGHLARAQRQQRATQDTEGPKPRGKRLKASAFDEAPATPAPSSNDCCTVKR